MAIPDTGQLKVGWVVGQSIATELDLALTGAGGYFMSDALPPDITALLSSLPAEWLEDWQRFLGRRRRMVSVLNQVAYLSDVLVGGDYAEATLAMRELDCHTALETLEARFPGCAEAVSPAGADPGTRLVDRLMRLLGDAYAGVGFPGFEGQRIGRQAREQSECMVRILKDGDLHERFWHWLDRFFYGHYELWRRTQVQRLREIERQVVSVLGARASAGGSPDLGWLPRLNPLNHHAPLAESVMRGRLRVFFWIEPVGIPDVWSLWPGLVTVSTSQGGDLLDNFRAFAEDVASRVRAVGDPTRLAILRLIRHMGIPNSSIADYLGLAQPTVSVHAKILRDAGFIRSRKEGRIVRHEVVAGELERLFRDLDRLLDLPSGPLPELTEEEEPVI